MKSKICLQIIVTFLFSILLTTIVSAAPITDALVYAFRDNEGASPVFTGQGDNFSFGVSGVVPDGNNGTTAIATHLATGANIDPLPNYAGSLRPGLFGQDISFDVAQSNNWLTPWMITLANGSDTATRTTPDRTGIQKMEFVENLAISGSGTAPTVSWVLPTTGAPVDRVRYEVWNNDTDQVLIGPSTVPPVGATAIEISLSGLQIGTNYAIRIIPEQRDALGTVSRSSNWLGWQAQEGAAEGTWLELTTGSPAGVSQTVNTSDIPFTVEFDYRFTTATGFFDVLLDGIAIGTRLVASAPGSDEFMHAVFEVEDTGLLGLTGVSLLFLLDGPTGSNILIDNIIFPGLLNGDFENGLALWTPEGQGIVAASPVPEPSTMILVAGGLAGLFWVGRKRKVA